MFALCLGGACTSVVPVPRWCLCLGGACASVVPVPRWCLCLGDACASVVPVPRWCLCLGGACASVVPVPRRCLCLGGDCASVVLVPRWCLWAPCQSIALHSKAHMPTSQIPWHTHTNRCPGTTRHSSLLVDITSFIVCLDSVASIARTRCRYRVPPHHHIIPQPMCSFGADLQNHALGIA